MTRKNNLQQFGVVLGFEYSSYLRNKVYLILTIIFCFLIALGLSLPNLITLFKSPAEQEPDAHDPAALIHVISKASLPGSLAALQAALPDENFIPAAESELEDLKDSVNNGKARAVLVLGPDGGITLIERRAGSFLPEQLKSVLNQTYREQVLAEYGLSQDQIKAALADPAFDYIETVAGSGKSAGQTMLYTYLLLFLLYMTVMLYGQLVANSVATEKSNRAMEMLITSARPLNLMFGKVIGSGLAGLTQIGLFLLTAASFYFLNKASWSEFAIIDAVFQMPGNILFFTVLFYLLGYFMFAFLYGALGSLASRTEDINTSIMPVMLLIMSAMFVAMFGMVNPEAAHLTVFSFLPFFGPMVMFVRISMTDVPTWQIILSIAVMLLTIYGTGWLSSRIYRLGVLMYGKPPRLGQLITQLRQAKNQNKAV